MALFARFLLDEQALRIAHQFEKLHALGHVGFVGLLVLVDLALAAVLLFAPLVRHFPEEARSAANLNMIVE